MAKVGYQIVRAHGMKYALGSSLEEALYLLIPPNNLSPFSPLRMPVSVLRKIRDTPLPAFFSRHNEPAAGELGGVLCTYRPLV